MDIEHTSLNEPWRPGAERRKEQSGTKSKILSTHRGVCSSSPWHQKRFILRCEETHLLPSRLPTGLVAGRGAKLPRSSWGVWCLVRRGQRAVSLRATTLWAGVLCRLPRPRWGQALSQLTWWQEKWSVPCHFSLLCCWLIHCFLMGPYPRFRLLLCPFQPSTIALFLLGFA